MARDVSRGERLQELGSEVIPFNIFLLTLVRAVVVRRAFGGRLIRRCYCLQSIRSPSAQFKYPPDHPCALFCCFPQVSEVEMRAMLALEMELSVEEILVYRDVAR